MHAPPTPTRLGFHRSSVRLATLHRNTSGATLVETALVLPVAMMFTLGILNLCLFVTCATNATFASRAAVRYAMLHGAHSQTPCAAADLTAIIMKFMVVPASEVTVTSTWTPGNTLGSTISVKVSVAYPSGIPFAGLGTITTATTATGMIVQ